MHIKGFITPMESFHPLIVLDVVLRTIAPIVPHKRRHFELENREIIILVKKVLLGPSVDGSTISCRSPLLKFAFVVHPQTKWAC